MPRRNFLDTLRALQQRWGDALKLRMLRKRIKTGVEALERGDFTEVEMLSWTHIWRSNSESRTRRIGGRLASKNPGVSQALDYATFLPLPSLPGYSSYSIRLCLANIFVEPIGGSPVEIEQGADK